MQNGGWSNGGAAPDLSWGVDNYFLNGTNVASISNGKLYIFDHNAVVGAGAADYLHSFGYPEASQVEVSNAINEDAPGNGAGKGSMREGITSTLAALAMMYGVGSIADMAGSYLSGAPASASSAGGGIQLADAGNIMTDVGPGYGGGGADWMLPQPKVAPSYLGGEYSVPGYSVPGVGGASGYSVPALTYSGALGDAGSLLPALGAAASGASGLLPPGTQAPAPVEDRTPTPVSQSSGFNLRDAASIASLASAAAGFLRGGSTSAGSSGFADLGPDGTLPGASDPTGAPLPPVVDPSVQAALDAAEAQRKAEEERTARIKAGTQRVNEMFGGFNDDYYGSIAEAYKNFQMPLLDEQAKEARRVLPFGTASTQSSAYQRQAGNLERDISRQTADIGNKAVTFANTRRGEVENSRSGLLNLAQSGADVETVNAAAADSAKVFGTPSPYIQGAIVPTPVSQQQFSPISDLFAKYTADAANGALAQRQGYLPPKFSTPLTFSTGTGGNRSAVQNINGP